MPVKKSPLEKLVSLASDFVIKQKGAWGHEEWENLVAAVVKEGFALEDEGKRNLGNVLEALKYFYLQSPPTETAAKPKKKSASKS